MRPIPKKLRDEMADDPYYSMCAREVDGGCSGRITWEHAIIYAGKQLNEKFAIIPLCEYHHLGEGLVKEINVCIALNRATEQELQAISKAINYQRERDRLNNLYPQHART